MYQFLDLKHTLPSDDIDNEKLFELSQTFITDSYSYSTSSEEILKWLNAIMVDDESYFVMHERMLFKGKLKKYIGHVVIAKKADIIEFVQNAIGTNDLRPIRILATESPDFLIRFNEDSVIHLHKY